MEEVDLIYSHPDNYHKWSQIIIKFLSQHNVLPYVRVLEYNLETSSLIDTILFLYMDYEVLDSLIDLKAFYHYDNYIYLWEMYGDPNIPPFPKDLIPPVVVNSSLDEITSPAPVDPTDLVPATDASDSVQQDPLCLPTLPSCDDFLLTLACMFLESHIEDVGDTIDDIRLLFGENFSSITVMIDLCTSTQQGTLCLPVLALGVDFLTDILGLFMESHIVYLENFFDDIPLLFVEDDPSIVVVRTHFDPHVHYVHDQSLQVGVIMDPYVQ